MGIPYAEVIGDPIAHSKSPLIHNFWLGKLGVEGNYLASCVPAKQGELAQYLAVASADPDWRGCSVTAPHKRAIVALLDGLSPEAEQIGAVNIVAREGTELVGHNSDGRGFLEPLRPFIARAHYGGTAIILGTGGAARAVAHAFLSVASRSSPERNFDFAFASRDRTDAARLVTELGGHHYAYSMSRFAQPTECLFSGERTNLLDLLVNATPLGMHGEKPLSFDLSHLPKAALVYDLVYSPVETRLLKAARERGHPVLDGLHMLVGQAAIAFELFFGQPAPREHDAELRALLTR